MATLKQKRAVKMIVENRGMAVSRVMASPEVGYKPKTAKNPKNLTESDGFKEELENYGLTTELVKSSLVSDIEAKPGKRVAELNLAADILNMKKDKPSDLNKTVVAVQVIINGHNAQDRTNGETIQSS